MSEQVHNTVFLSYRRTTSWHLAQLIYRDLTAHGYDVFMDVKSLDSGLFDNVLLRQIEARAHFLILCVPGTFDRVHEEGDRVRREIEHAITHNRNIVPILCDFTFDAATKKILTGLLAKLPGYNGLSAPHEYFDAAMEKLRQRFLRAPVEVAVSAVPATDVAAVRKVQQTMVSDGVRISLVTETINGTEIMSVYGEKSMVQSMNTTG